MSNTANRSRHSGNVTPSTQRGTATDPLSSRIDGFEHLSPFRALAVVTGIAMAMLLYIFSDQLLGKATLLYTDIGSDSVNIFYPMYVQAAKLWAAHQSTSGFSLEIVMGSPVSINVWDPLTWIIVLGGADNVPYTLAYVEILKMLLITMLAFGFFRMQGMRNTTASIGALCMAFSGYAALGASGWYYHSHEVLLIALACWATEYALAKRRLFFLVLPAAIFLIAHTNSMMAVYLTAMLVVYLLIRMVEHADWKQRLASVGLTLALLVAGLALSYDQFAALRSQVTESGRAESIKKAGAKSAYGTNMDVGIFDMAQSKERANIVLRSYSGAMMGSGNAYKGMMNFLEGPLLYYGLPMLLFIPFFLVTTDVRRRLVFGILLAGLLLLVFFPWFRFAFWGFTLDYYREYTMLIGAAFLIMAMRGLDAFAASPVRSAAKWIPAATAFLAIMVLHGVGDSPTLVSIPMRTAVTVLLAGFTIAAVVHALSPRGATIAAIMALTIVDLSINANSTINDRGVLTSAAIERGDLYRDASAKAVSWIMAHDAGLYRIAKLDLSGPAMHKSLNDAMVMGFNGIIGYSSWHNKYFLRFMDEMGLTDRSTAGGAKWVFQAMFRPYLSSLLGVKYFIRADDFIRADTLNLKPLHRIGNSFINESNLAQPLLVAYDAYVTPQQFSSLEPVRKELQLFRSAVVGSVDIAGMPIAPYPLASDTATSVSLADVARWAQDRRSLMSVRAATTKDGIEAAIDLQKDALVVTHIPYDPTMVVTVDGTAVPTIIANIGFIGFPVRAGRHTVRVEYKGS